MARFDIINAAGNAYQTSWAARRYLLRLAAVPLALKLLCFTVATQYAGGGNGQEGNYILFMLIMVPALLAEGWMLSHYVRFIVLGQTWPFRPTGDIEADRAMLSTRARGILGGMIVYVLINMAIGLLSDFSMRVMGPYVGADMTTAEDIPPAIPLLSVFLLVLMVMGFRLLWVYIPFALNMDTKTYLQALKGGSGAVALIGTWMLCFIPFVLVMRFVGPVFEAFPGGAGGFLVTLLSIVMDTLKGIVTTAGVTFGLREIFTRPNQRLDRRA